MTLRNLNQVSNGQRVLGTPKTGVLGSLIPSGGDQGAGYAYASLSLPADANKEICGRITAWPSAGVLTAKEDTSFSFTGAPNGTYTFNFQLVVDGVSIGSPATVTLGVGGVGTIYCGTGDASATGLSAAIGQGVIINGVVGSASAAGLNATIAQGNTINGLVGNATATGLIASIGNSQSNTINAVVGNGTATGLAATIAQGVVIACTASAANATGLSALVGNSQTNTINGSTGNTTAAGLTATIAQGSAIACTVGNAAANGVTATINSAQTNTINCAVGDVLAVGSSAVISNGTIFVRAPLGDGYRPAPTLSVRPANLQRTIR